MARRSFGLSASERRSEMEVDVFKSKAPEKDQNAATNVAEVVGRTVQQQYSVVEQPPPMREPTTDAVPRSCIGSGMSIVGNIECKGPAQVFGRVKGTIRAVRVKLQNGGSVEGDIFHRSLSIDENSLFEGSSRRVENPTDLSSVDAKGPQKSPAPSPLPSIDADLQRVEGSTPTEWSESTVGPKQ